MGHGDVEENQRDFLLEEDFEGGAARRGPHHAMAESRQDRLEREKIVAMVVHNQDLHRLLHVHVKLDPPAHKRQTARR